MSDWDESSGSESEAAPQKKATPAPPPPAKRVAVPKKKWEGEDEDDNAPVSDWEESSSEEEEDSKPAVAPPKKKGNFRAKVAEKEAEKAKRIANGEIDYDSDDVLDPREKARRDKERELNADLNNAAELLGAAALGGTSSSELDAILSAQPRTKDDFHKLSTQIYELIIKRHAGKPLYSAFLEQFARECAQPLKDVEARKVASALTTLANEKQKEQRDKASGKKKAKSAAKPALGGSKSAVKGTDTGLYDEALDDFGNNPDDFM
ncbi:translation initiation factor eIF3 subunit [Coprinopsis marcescibilis]|uniref:Eukaryotic translation initiation factor 3 subunit J n=1 Tax=Coprinopsis marcescibilis TaxID=230819 RepID=A0A5C3KT03_COPMA|nr:translation initiation factor eIF3 subunit [Coprinopsis marcescibilis]